MVCANAVVAAAFVLVAVSAWAEPKFVEGQILVKPKAGATEKVKAAHKQFGGEVVETFKNLGDIQVVRIPKGKTVAEAVAHYKKLADVEFAEPDYIVSINLTPNDPKFTDGTLWGMHNTGQSGGTADADIDAPEAWNTRTDASSTIVAVIDTGVRYTHEDLAGNMWKNPGETGLDANGNDKATNGIDDDGNGLVDDVYGAKYVGVQISGDPNDDNGHGSHVSGTIGGFGNNGKGVVGVCWRVKIMALKFLNSAGSGSSSDAIKCINYAIAKGAHVLSNSWGGGGYSTSLYNAINSARNAGIIFVAAAGNNGANNDATPFYPASYNLDNIISVAATDRNDALASFSNYGATSVDIGAPGVSIYSTVRTSDTAYATYSGTSMACPHVAGAVALVKAEFPTLTYSQLRSRILTNVDVIASLTGKCVSNGRLNLHKALTAGTTPPPPPNPAQIAVSPASRNFGDVEVGSSSDLTFTVSNTGSETLSGSASVPAPFSIVGGSPYNISGGGNTAVTVRFAPGAVGNYNETVTFTGGGGTTASVSGTGTEPPPVDNPPTVTISSPANGASYLTTDVVTFTGSAGDDEDGDLTANIVWTSSVDGVIGNGGSFSDTLSEGTHVITASVTDSASQTTVATVTITVAAPLTPPVAPTDLAARATGRNIQLTWTHTGNNEAGFTIERKTGGGTFAPIATVGANTTSYTDSNLAKRTTYTYRMRAFNDAGNSGYSNEASATTK